MSYTIAADGLSITCGFCGLTSHNLNDVKLRFCGMCLVFHDDVARYASKLDIPLRCAVLVAAKAGSQVFEKRGSITAPIWHAFKANGESLIVPHLSDRETQLQLLRALFEIEDVARYTVVAEAWLARDRWNQEPSRGTAANHPNRIEILHIHGEDRREGMLTARRDITRGKHGARLGPLQIGSANEEYRGAMYGLLPRGTTH